MIVRPPLPTVGNSLDGTLEYQMSAGRSTESDILSRVLRAASVPSGSRIRIGIGDDCAIYRPRGSGEDLLFTTDMLLEDIHFRLDWHPPYLLGRKSLAVSISDIAAMGGIPRWALLSVALPKETPLDFIDRFTSGFFAMAAEHGVALIGGDGQRLCAVVLAGHGVQHQQPAAMAPRFLLNPRHQRRCNAAAARGAMHQCFLDVGAMRLIGRRIEAELDGTDDFAVQPRRQQYGVTRSHRRRDFPEERQRLRMRERRHEADGSATLDAIDQHFGELIQRGLGNRCVQNRYVECRAHAARSSFEATVASAFSR